MRTRNASPVVENERLCSRAFRQHVVGGTAIRALMSSERRLRCLAWWQCDGKHGDLVTIIPIYAVGLALAVQCQLCEKF